MTTTDAPANAQPLPRSSASDQKPPKLPREEDPRNPNYRLAAFFDEGTLELISD